MYTCAYCINPLWAHTNNEADTAGQAFLVWIIKITGQPHGHITHHVPISPGSE